MAHSNLPSEHHESPEGTWWIWKVFIILLVVTTVEVVLGIIKPEEFMHLKFEKKNFMWTIALPMLILIPYLTFIILSEGGYMGDFLK